MTEQARTVEDETYCWSTYYSLLTTRYSLLAAHYLLLATHYSRLTTRYSRLITCYLLLTTLLALLLATHCSLQALEAARVNAMRSSDVTTALDQCLKMMGDAEVADVMPSVMISAASSGGACSSAILTPSTI